MSSSSSSSSSNVLNGLRYWWKFDDAGSGTAVDSADSNNGTVYNFGTGTTATAGVKGSANSAYNFDGVNGYISTNNATMMNGWTAFTINAWVYLTSFSPSSGAFLWHRGATYGGFYTAPSPDTWYYFFNNNTKVVSITDMPLNSWQMVSVTWSSGNTLKMYRNGILVNEASGAYTGSFSQDAVQLIAKDVYGAGLYHNMKADSVRIYDRALNVTELNDIYTQERYVASTSSSSSSSVDSSSTSSSSADLQSNSSQSSSQSSMSSSSGSSLSSSSSSSSIDSSSSSSSSNVLDGLVSWWKFDDAGAGTAIDTMGANNGTVTYATAVPGVKGEEDTAYRCQYNNPNYAFISTNNTTLMHGWTAFTKCAWIYPNQWDPLNSTEGGALLWHRGSNYSGFYSSYATSPHDQILIYFFSNGTPNVTKTGMLENVWQFVTVTWTSGDYLRMYVDGQLAATSASTYSGSYSQDAAMLICKDVYGGGIYHDWTVDSVRIYNRALSITEIQKIYDQERYYASTSSSSYSSSSNSSQSSSSSSSISSSSNSSESSLSSSSSSSSYPYCNNTIEAVGFSALYNGVYTKDGEYDERPYWVNANNKYIFWDDANYWVIANSLGGIQIYQSTVAGFYCPYGNNPQQYETWPGGGASGYIYEGEFSSSSSSSISSASSESSSSKSSLSSASSESSSSKSSESSISSSSLSSGSSPSSSSNSSSSNSSSSVSSNSSSSISSESSESSSYSSSSSSSSEIYSSQTSSMSSESSSTSDDICPPSFNLMLMRTIKKYLDLNSITYYISAGEEEATYPFTTYVINDTRNYPEEEIHVQKIYETITVRFSVYDKYPSRSRIITILKQLETIFDCNTVTVTLPYSTSNNMWILCSHMKNCWTTPIEKTEINVFWQGNMDIEFQMGKDWHTR